MAACQFSYPPVRSFYVFILWALILSGCATWSRPTQSIHQDATRPEGECAAFFAALDEQVVKDNALDAGYARVKDYPYLRVDRFVASFRNDIVADNAFSAWVDQMQGLDRSARRSEIANLSDDTIAAMAPFKDREELFQRVVECGDTLKQYDFSKADGYKILRDEVDVPAEYISSRRAAGLYPITKLFVSHGVRRWHAEARAQFSTEPPPVWRSIRYVPVGTMDVATTRRIVQSAERDNLGIPFYKRNDLTTLFGMYAPIWEVQQQSGDDRIGRPRWLENNLIGVDTQNAETFTLLSFTRFGKAILTQLNYAIWFPARPKRHAGDIYGGALDGLTYRITLDLDGAPILYETIHNCGCFYKAYPTDRLHVRDSIDYAEPPLILQAPETTSPIKRMVLALESRTHYLHHFYPDRGESRPGDKLYTLVDYAGLKTLPKINGQRQSMFNRYGIVSGSERLERFILWPMGVHSPGAMRQMGRQAITLVGKRHFDDPFYLEKMFVPID